MGNRRWQLIILASIAGLGGVTLLIPTQFAHPHNFLHHLYFIPLMAAGMKFEWRRASLFALFAACADAPQLWITWQRYPPRAADNAAELAIFAIAAIITGVFSERERRQRKSLEQTKSELEGVYKELQSNVERLKKAERLSAAGQLSAGLAHEIRNPLASISGAAGILERAHGTQEDNADCLQIIQAESQRLNRLLTSFLDFARPRSLRIQPIEVAPLLDSVLALASHHSASPRVELRSRVASDLELMQCDPELLKQVLINLVLNAIQASPAGGAVEVRASRAAGSVIIEVHDEGRGIPVELRERIFEPFFTTRENGTGLGLALAFKIVEQHGGSLTAGESENGGALLRVQLPHEESRQ